MEKKIDDLLWKTFVKSGDAGYYMLYRAIKEEEDNQSLSLLNIGS